MAIELSGDDKLKAVLFVDGMPVVRLEGNPFTVMSLAEQYANQYDEEGHVTIKTTKVV